MLQAAEPHTTLARQISNLDFIIEKTIPWMEANPDRVDLDHWQSDCETYACLGGWYSVQRYGDAGSVPSICDEFGFTDVQGENLGPFSIVAFAGTLSDREAYLITHRQSLINKLAEVSGVAA